MYSTIIKLKEKRKWWVYNKKYTLTEPEQEVDTDEISPKLGIEKSFIDGTEIPGNWGIEIPGNWGIEIFGIVGFGIFITWKSGTLSAIVSEKMLTSIILLGCRVTFYKVLTDWCMEDFGNLERW